MNIQKLILICILIVFTASACQPSGRDVISAPTVDSMEQVIAPQASLVAVSTPTPPKLFTPQPTITPTQGPSPTPTSPPSASPTFTITELPSETPIATLTPTYSILRGTVLEQSNCRYGPGAAYLYKYGLYAGNNLEIIGRNEYGTWILVRAIGGTNPCWLKASLMDIKGNMMSLAPASLPLPQSPYYGPLTGVSSQRQGNNVIISWDTLNLKAGDDSLQYPYLIEAWLCQAGQLLFTPIGSWETMVTVQDEPGCAEASHARVYGVEKHGYTRWVEVPWTQP